MTAKGTQIKSSTVQSNAKLLQKEGRKILRKHEDRVGQEAAHEIRASLAAIDHLKGAMDWKGLSDETEKLDELLQKHASFARKSALREIAESVGFAVGVALLLRCCTYEPFNIPSISMMPTLRIGDYIFVNKFARGIQVPFTNHILAEDVMGPIERGEVIVFRFPADPSVDYIKRVIGIPGDVIRVQGQKMWIQKGGEGEFEEIQRKKLDRPCTQSEDPNRSLANCVVYEETLDGRKYLIRLVQDDMQDLLGHDQIRTIVVPPRKYFVRGDNRQQSQDSLMWEQVADVAQVQKLLRPQDLKAVLKDPELNLRRELDPDLALDPHRARVRVHAQQGGPATQHGLEVWRNAEIPAQAIYQGIRQAKGLDWKSSRVDKLLEGSSLGQAERNRALNQGRKWDALAVAEQGDVFHALMRWDSQNLVVLYQCGKQLCPDQSKLATALTQAVEAAQKDPKARAKSLLRDPKLEQSASFLRREAKAPDDLRRRYYVGRYQSKGSQKPVFRTEVFLRDHEGLDVIEASRFAAAGSGTAMAKRENRPNGSLRWAKGSDGAFIGAWRTFEKPGSLITLRCEAAACANQGQFIKRLDELQNDLFAVAKGNLRPAALLRSQADLQLNSDNAQPEAYPWDKVQSAATLEGERQTLDLEVDWKGPQDRSELLAQWRGPDAAGKEIEAQLGTGSFMVDTPSAYKIGWMQPNTDTAMHMQCGKDLCRTPDMAIAMANKISEQASNEDNFIARKQAIPQPFVPRGHVKGRSDIIWWPLNRLGESMDQHDSDSGQ